MATADVRPGLRGFLLLADYDGTLFAKFVWILASTVFKAAPVPSRCYGWSIRGHIDALETNV
jgi:hypothetical protein